HRGTTIPFDIAHRLVLFYDLAQPGSFIDAFATYLDRQATSPAEREGPAVRASLERLGAVSGPGDELGFEQDQTARIQRAENSRQLVAVWQWARQFPSLPTRQLGELARRLQKQREWKASAEVLERATRDRPDDYDLRRSFGWSLCKLLDFDQAEKEL